MINEWRIEMDVKGGECRLFHITQASWGLINMTKTVKDDSSGRGTSVAQVRSFAT